MKRAVLLAVVLMLAAALPVFAANRTVMIVDDVIKMSKAGVGEDEIIAFVKKAAEPFDITGDDVIAMTDANVPRAVVKAVIDESSVRMRSERAADRRDSDRRDDTRTTRVYVGAGVYPSYWDPFYYDPFWYGGYGWYGYRPGISVGIGFGPRFGIGFRGGFHHRRHR